MRRAIAEPRDQEIADINDPAPGGQTPPHLAWGLTPGAHSTLVSSVLASLAYFATSL
jgi:hypothetical protein